MSLEKTEIFDIIEPVVRALDFQIVDLNTAKIRTGLQVTLIIYHPDGVSIKSCTEISRAILPRLEVHSGDRDVHLEVSSPGITRNIKSTHEFSVFKGRDVCILLKTDDEWVQGIIMDTDENAVCLHTVDVESLSIPFNDIQKAKLAG